MVYNTLPHHQTPENVDERGEDAGDFSVYLLRVNTFVPQYLLSGITDTFQSMHTVARIRKGYVLAFSPVRGSISVGALVDKVAACLFRPERIPIFNNEINDHVVKLVSRFLDMAGGENPSRSMPSIPVFG